MADSACTNGSDQLIIPHEPKLVVLPQGWIIGETGNGSADLLLLSGLDYERIEDPLYHRERFKALKDGDWHISRTIFTGERLADRRYSETRP